MKLRDLKRGGISVWPPAFTGSYGPGDKIPVGDVGVVTGVRKAGVPGIRIEIEYKGRPYSGVLAQWDEGPTLESVVEALQRYIGKPVASLPDAEITSPATRIDEPESVRKEPSASQRTPAPSAATTEPAARLADPIRPASAADLPTARDTLGYKPYVEALHTFLTWPETSPPLTVSVEGEWGSGKSSLMRQLEDALRTRGVVPVSGWTAVWRYLHDRVSSDPQPTVWFDAWTHDKDETLWAAFMLQVLHQLPRRLSPARRWWGHAKLMCARIAWRKWVRDAFPTLTFGLVATVALAIAGVAVWIYGPDPVSKWFDTQSTWLNEKVSSTILKIAASVGLTGSGIAVWKRVAKVLRNPLELEISKYVEAPDYRRRLAFVEEFHADFAKVLKAYAGKRTVFVFIDDLDRCEVPKAADLMQALNLLVAREPQLIFVIGMDRMKVAAGLAAKYERLLPYLGASTAAQGLDFGYDFVERFVQVPFLVPRAAEGNLEQFLGTLTRPPQTEPSLQGLAVSATRGSWTRWARSWRGDSASSPLPPGGADASATDRLPERAELLRQIGDDAPALRRILRVIGPGLDYNPRRIKQFVNVFRLRAFIAEETGLLAPSGPLTMEQLAKFIVLTLRWPQFVRAMESEPDLLRRTQIAAVEKGGAQDAGVEEADTRERLMQFLRRGCMEEPGVPAAPELWSLASVDVAPLFRVSPRVRTIDVRRRMATASSDAPGAVPDEDRLNTSLEFSWNVRRDASPAEVKAVAVVMPDGRIRNFTYDEIAELVPEEQQKLFDGRPDIAEWWERETSDRMGPPGRPGAPWPEDLDDSSWKYPEMSGRTWRYRDICSLPIPERQKLKTEKPDVWKAYWDETLRRPQYVLPDGRRLTKGDISAMNTMELLQLGGADPDVIDWHMKGQEF